MKRLIKTELRLGLAAVTAMLLCLGVSCMRRLFGTPSYSKIALADDEDDFDEQHRSTYRPASRARVHLRTPLARCRIACRPECRLPRPILGIWDKRLVSTQHVRLGSFYEDDQVICGSAAGWSNPLVAIPTFPPEAEHVLDWTK
jgi:hypothetical protein